jgi:hypothetical protein
MSPTKNNFFQAIAERAGTWPARSVIALLFFAFLFVAPPDESTIKDLELNTPVVVH